MKYASLFPGLLLVAVLACLAQAAPAPIRAAPQESRVDVRANDLPFELRVLYYLIIDPSQDDIKKENYIFKAFELLQLKKYHPYAWFYAWLVDHFGYGYGPGRHTPRHGGHTPRGGPGGRTHGRRHGGPGGHKGRHAAGGPGGRTRHHGGYATGGGHGALNRH